MNINEQFEVARKVNDEWQKKIHGVVRQFENREDLVWGIELHIQVDAETRFELKKRGLKIPKHITEIVFLTLTPEEDLAQSNLSNYAHRDLREVLMESAVGSTSLTSIVQHEAVNNPYNVTPLITLATVIEASVNTRFLKLMFNYYLIRSRKKSSVLIINAHGGPNTNEKHMLGETTAFQRKDSMGVNIHAAGNRIDTDKILSAYSGTSNAVILLSSCNASGIKIPAHDIPVFYSTTLFRIMQKGADRPMVRIARPTY